jgi:hypothetical protein
MITKEQVTEYPPVEGVPVVWPKARRAVGVTIARLSVALLAIFVIGVARWLVPSPTGTGTHTQLYLPACGFKVITGLPCPSCGMTTAFSYMAHLQIARGFSAQPFGAGLFLAVVATALISLYCAFVNRSLLAIACRVFTARRGLLILLAFALVWVIQVLRALVER